MKHIKEKSRTRQQRQRMRAHRRSMVLISSVIMLLIVLVSVGGVSLRAKNEAYKKQQAELETQIKEEKDRPKVQRVCWHRRLCRRCGKGKIWTCI